VIVAITFVATALTVWLIVLTKGIHGRWTLDNELTGVQRFHDVPVPRVGGLAMIVGLMAGGIYHGLQGDHELFQIKWAAVAALPVFLGGLIEDLTKRFSPRDRLLLAFLSAAIAYYELRCGLTRTEWLWFDKTILSFPGVSLVLTVTMIGGVAHAANIIDGFNGLLIGFAILALVAFAWVANQNGLHLHLAFISIVIGTLLGILVWNFPHGKIFCGDGGAYLIGFMLAIISLLLVKASNSISPWFPLLVLIYPVMETIFSMYRKKMWRGISVSLPDGAHLHMLIYGRVVRRIGIDKKYRNAATGVIIWLLSLSAMLPAVLWWNSTNVLLVVIALWCVAYVLLYFRLIRFATNSCYHQC